jgi:dihydrofolate reductase
VPKRKEEKMSKLTVFNQITLDGYFTDEKNDMSWAHQAGEDPEWKAYGEENAKGGGVMVFGRITYELMASYWPTPQAAKNDPVLAKQMNSLPKLVFSRTLDEVSWANTRLLKGDLTTEIEKAKKESERDLVIMGSGTIVRQCAEQGLIDEYELVVFPIVLGKGRTLFEGIEKRLALKLEKAQSFKNGNVVLHYVPKA